MTNIRSFTQTINVNGNKFQTFITEFDRITYIELTTGQMS